MPVTNPRIVHIWTRIPGSFVDSERANYCRDPFNERESVRGIPSGNRLFLIPSDDHDQSVVCNACAVAWARERGIYMLGPVRPNWVQRLTRWMLRYE